MTLGPYVPGPASLFDFKRAGAQRLFAHLHSFGQARGHLRICSRTQARCVVFPAARAPLVGGVSGSWVSLIVLGCSMMHLVYDKICILPSLSSSRRPSVSVLEPKLPRPGTEEFEVCNDHAARDVEVTFLGEQQSTLCFPEIGTRFTDTC